IWRLCHRYRTGYRTTWFRPARCTWRDRYTWEDIRQILGKDPLNEAQFKRLRGIDLYAIPSDIIKVVLAIMALFIGGYYIFDPSFAVRFKSDIASIFPVAATSNNSSG